MPDKFSVNTETIRKILVEDLCKIEFVSRFVPYALSDDQRQERVQYAKYIIKTSRRNKNFLNSIVAEVETWFFRYDHISKRQSAEWKYPAPPKGKNFRLKNAKLKKMLCVFRTAREFFITSLSLRDKLSLEDFI